MTSYSYHADDALQTLSHNVTGTANDVDWSYGFNKVNQLTSKILSGGANLALYKWEPQYKKNDGYTSNGLNQYSTVAGANLSYDPSGNLTSDGVWSFTYDVENMLLNASKPGVSASYLYGPLGRRSAKSVDGVLTTFLHDGVEEIADYNASGSLLRRYVHGPGVDEYLVMYTGSGTSAKSYFHANHQGSIVAMSDGSGNVTEQHSYDSYGNSDELTGNPFRYTGRRLDEETGLYYYRARYYWPGGGRFLQTDPIGYGDGLNWYAYVGNDPVNKTDPTGLCGTRLKGHSASNCKTIWFGAESGGGSGAAPAPKPKPIPNSNPNTTNPAPNTAANDNSVTTVTSAQDFVKRTTIVGLGVVAAEELDRETNKRHVTYTKVHSVSGKVYSGRTSGIGTAAYLVKKRDLYHHKNLDGYGPAIVDQQSFDKWAIRGREQMLIDYNGGAQSVGGSSGNAINGINDWNPLRPYYLKSAIIQFGNLPNNRPQ